MVGDRLSAKEAALIAQARADLQRNSSAQAGLTAVRQGAPTSDPPAAPAEAAPARIEPSAPAAPIEQVAPRGAAATSGPGPTERVALLMATARADAARRRARQKMLYVWVPVAFLSVTSLWTLVWMWHKL